MGFCSVAVFGVSTAFDSGFACTISPVVGFA
jgi:hypothetical protein